MKSFEAQILKADYPTSSGTIFPADLCAQMVEEIQKSARGHRFLVELGTSTGHEPFFSNVCGEVERAWMKEGILCVQVLPLVSEKGKILTMLRRQGIRTLFQIKGKDTLAEPTLLQHKETGNVIQVKFVKKFTPTCLAAWIP